MNANNITTQELISRAVKFEEEGSKTEALSLWETVIERERDPVSLCQFGLLAMEVGRQKDAYDAFVEALALKPNFALGEEFLAKWYDKQGDLRESLKHHEARLRIEQTADAHILLGTVQLRLCCVSEARKSFNAALKIDPRNEEAYYNLGITYALEEPGKAVTLFQKAVELDPEYAIAHSELGWALLRLDDNAAAECHLRRAIELDQADGWAHVYLSNLLWAKRDFSSAEECYKAAIKVWPDSSIPYWSLAMFYQYQDRSQEANEFFEQALTIDPDNPEAHRRFGVYLMEIGETGKAKAHIERARVLSPDDPTIRELLDSLR